MEGAPSAEKEPELEAQMGFSALSIQHHSRADSEQLSPRSACIETLSPRNHASRVGDILTNNPRLLFFAVPGAFLWNGGLMVVVSALVEGVALLKEPLPVMLILLGLVFLLASVVGGIKIIQVVSQSFPTFLLESLFLLLFVGVGLYTLLGGGLLPGVLFGFYYCGVTGLVYWLDVRSAKTKLGVDSFSL